MKFRVTKRSRRTPEEQHCIYDIMLLWKTLPENRREEAGEIIRDLTSDDREQRALFAVLTRGISLRARAESAGIPLARLSCLRAEFYDRFPIR